MRRHSLPLYLVLVFTLAAFILGGCLAGANGGKGGAEGTARQESGVEPDLVKVRLQLKWAPQAQFAGYFVALDKGYYEEEGLDVEILPAGPDLNASDQVAEGFADIGTDWVPPFLIHVSEGKPLIQFAQIYQHSGTTTVFRQGSGIASVPDLRGRKVGVWFGGNEYEFLALLDKYDLVPDRDLELIAQGFTMEPFLAGEMDAAAATTYNEYWMVINAGVPAEAIDMFDFNAEGVAMLQDNLFAREEWLAENEDTAVRFLRASIKGWRDAVTEPEKATEIVMNHVLPGSTTYTQQRQMMESVAELVVPPGFSLDRIGEIDAEAFQRTVDIAHRFGLLENPIDADTVYTSRIWQAVQNSN